MPYNIIAMLVLGSFCASTGTVLLKMGATGRTTLLSFVNTWIVLGLALYGLGAIFWIYGMSKQSLVSVYPFTVLTFVIVYGAGILLFGETPSRSGIVGVACILLGLYLVARQSV